MSSLLNNVKNLVHSPTEIKVRQATSDDENFGATGTLMNEISVLTYSPRTLKEIIPIVRKRLLLGCNKKNVPHKNCIMLVKTLTLVSYLLNNGSNEFIRWSMSNIDIFQSLKALPQSAVNLETDGRLHAQITGMARDITLLAKDPELLEQRRRDVVQFRSSISSPGRKSTDNTRLVSLVGLHKAANGMNTYSSTTTTGGGGSSHIKNKNTSGNQDYTQQYRHGHRHRHITGTDQDSNENDFRSSAFNHVSAVRSTRSLDLRRNLPYTTMSPLSSSPSAVVVDYTNQYDSEEYRRQQHQRRQQKQPASSSGRRFSGKGNGNGDSGSGSTAYYGLAPLKEEEVVVPIPMGAPSTLEDRSNVCNNVNTVKRRFKPTNPFAYGS